eukprot:scaffold349080_cov33-Prasinocladus_malaysianus.AAC.3
MSILVPICTAPGGTVRVTEPHGLVGHTTAPHTPTEAATRLASFSSILKMTGFTCSPAQH